jgi:hypothetical protein
MASRRAPSDGLFSILSALRLPTAATEGCGAADGPGGQVIGGQAATPRSAASGCATMGQIANSPGSSWSLQPSTTPRESLHSKVLDLTMGGPMGTHYYCSMEQWASGRCDQTGDVYSLGVVLAELAAGRALPISPVGSGIQHAVVSGSAPVVQAFNATIRAMTAMVPSVRFQSMSEVAHLLLQISQSP